MQYTKEKHTQILKDASKSLGNAHKGKNKIN